MIPHGSLRGAVLSTVKSPDARVAAILDQLAARGCAGRRPGRQSSRRSVDVSTVYRTLDTLEQLGIIDHTHLAHGPAIFHLADGDHQHLVCERCGRVEEVAPEKLEPFLRR